MTPNPLEPFPHSSRPDRIVLVGFMGAGKTTVGRALAERLGWPFADTDAIVEASEGRTIEQVFRSEGEGYFREREWEALQAALAMPRAVIATGGGLYLAETHQSAIRQRAVAVWIDAPFASMWDRCRASAARPLAATREATETLFVARRERYARADLRVDAAGVDAEAIAAEIERRIHAPPRSGTESGEN